MKHSNLILKHLLITQTHSFLNTQILYTEHHLMIIFTLLQKYIQHLTEPTSSLLLLPNHKCGTNGKIQNGGLVLV
jgi:hypothetical protein